MLNAFSYVLISATVPRESTGAWINMPRKTPSIVLRPEIVPRRILLLIISIISGPGVVWSSAHAPRYTISMLKSGKRCILSIYLRQLVVVGRSSAAVKEMYI